jgi:nitric oxide reductase subunit B
MARRQSPPLVNPLFKPPLSNEDVMNEQTKLLVRWHFIAALGLFGLQIVFGLFMVAQYLWPDFAYNTPFGFNNVRSFHTNLLVFWLLLGFFASAFYIVSDESDSGLWSIRMGWASLALFLLGGVTGLVGYLFGWTQGREFTELPAPIDAAVVLVVGMYLTNIIMTVMKGRRRTSIEAVLLVGLVSAAVLYLPAQIFFKNESAQSFYWWWTVHLWVEGVWELIMGAILAYILIKVTGVDREVMEKWLYVVVSLTLFTGILGLGHHYYWNGAEKHWLTIGAFFSALEPLSFFSMVIYAVVHTLKRKQEHPNKAAVTWSIGCTIAGTVGVLLGFAQTLPRINALTHGTHVTTSHGHLAFFGAYAMIVLAMMAFAAPVLAGIEPSRWNQRRSLTSFWMMLGAMCAMSTAQMIAGVVQTVYERVQGMDYMAVQEFPIMKLSYGLWGFFGLLFALGASVFIYDFIRPAELSTRTSIREAPLPVGAVPVPVSVSSAASR